MKGKWVYIGVGIILGIMLFITAIRDRETDESDSSDPNSFEGIVEAWFDENVSTEVDPLPTSIEDSGLSISIQDVDPTEAVDQQFIIVDEENNTVKDKYVIGTYIPILLQNTKVYNGNMLTFDTIVPEEFDCEEYVTEELSCDDINRDVEKDLGIYVYSIPFGTLEKIVDFGL